LEPQLKPEGTVERRRSYQRAWHNAAYAKNPEKFKYRSRNRRRLHAVDINARRRKLAAQKRIEGLVQSAEEARRKLGREPQTLDEWFPTQSDFSEWAQVARAIGVSRTTMLDWRKGAHLAVRGHRRRLYELTRLACFADASNWKPREAHARKIGEIAAVPLLEEFVVRCGLASREIRGIRLCQIQDSGIRFDGGRFIRFGEKWEEVSQASLNDWLDRAKPTDLLFFSRKPVDRGLKASGAWISRVLHASGVKMHERRAARLRHFAGDFARLGAGKRFLDHLRRVHGLSESGARENVESLQKRRAHIREGALSQVEPKDAYDLLFPTRNKGGRPPMKRKVLLEAKKLHAAGKSWNEIARALLPDEFTANQARARERIRKGAKYYANVR